ncbi:MarR family winged helix-turn-helix transcriptional regulator [Paenibacillus caui]|uniref:MarR family winged helix-turn-helix transcriptional regulator n=1 Tax=Paenibacillus caui TaxID=2873927 RepID=UPI001CA7FF5C|nr:MarR family transcriptional regulator [Paenibacillus caui]
MDLFDSPGFLVNKLAHLMAVDLEKRLKAYGVTGSQWAILALLWEQEGLSQVEIQQLLDNEGATVTGILQRMDRAGLIKREADPHDRRVQRVYLTDAGKSLKDSLIPEAEAVNSKALRGFTDDETAFFIRLIRRTLQNF